MVRWDGWVGDSCTIMTHCNPMHQGSWRQERILPKVTVDEHIPAVKRSVLRLITHKHYGKTQNKCFVKFVSYI